MSGENHAGRRLWIGIPGIDLDARTREHLERIRPGGLVLFRRNYHSRQQLEELVAGCREIVGPQLHVSIDQEGGKVVRLTEAATPFPGNMALGAIAQVDLERACELAEAQGRATGQELRALGIDVNLAPCVDTVSVGDGVAIGTRSFGENTEHIVALAGAIVEGHQQGGVRSCIKHYPGLGGAQADPHLDLARVGRGDWNGDGTFRVTVDLAMTTHIVVDDIDAQCPATLSAPTITRLRSLSETPVVTITDDLEMEGMTRDRSFDAIVRGAVAAGHDLLCICHTAERQERAYELLHEGIKGGEAWVGVPQEIDARLDRLSALPATEPSREGSAIAAEIAERAVTELRPFAQPAPCREQALLVIPTPRITTLSQDPLRGETLEALEQALASVAETLRVDTHAAWSASEAKVRAASELLVTLCGARNDGHQERIARAALAWNKRVTYLLLAEPFDVEVVPRQQDCRVLCAYGMHPTQQQALAAVVRGVVTAGGACPVAL